MLTLGIAASSGAVASCFNSAGDRHGIDPALLRAIAEVESSMNPKAIGRNANGTIDVGLMQINSSHFARLGRAGITQEKLLNEPCTAVMVGAEILAGFIKKHGYTWRAVGAYNAGNRVDRERAREIYAGRVARQYERLTGNFIRIRD